MHTVKLNIKDNAYEHVMYILSKLAKSDIEIVEDIPDKNIKTQNLKRILDNRKTSPFKEITDPVEWQRKLRDEW